MLSTVLRTIRTHALVSPGERVLVAVSGGPDSTALLSAWLRIASRLQVTVTAAVVDHGLRPESTSEANMVADRCRAMGTSCAVLEVDVRAARGAHVSLQDAARRVRLAALESEATRQRCTRIALGHTADDQAETLLFRIVRGTGVRGLCGIPYQRGAFIRPLLDVRRREVLRFLSRRKLAFVTDPSNVDVRFARARVRNAWIPFLERENPRLVEALLALAADARQMQRGAPPAAWVRPELSRATIATVARLASARAGTKAVSVRGGSLQVSYGRVTWQPRAQALSETTPESTPAVEIPGPGVYRWGAMKVEVLEGGGAPPDEANVAVFDSNAVMFPLRLRKPRPGDRMRPRRGRGSRKLSDLLIDGKVPREERATLPVLEDAAGTILFVRGLRPSEIGRPRPSTRRWIQVRAS